MNVVYVFIGGGIGCVLRHLFSGWFNKMQFLAFPWSTFTANVVSCIVFAVSVLILGEKGAFSSGSVIRPLLLTGFCGGLSTFSTFSFETMELVRRGEFTMAAVNVIVNNVVCFAVFFMLAKK